MACRCQVCGAKLSSKRVELGYALCNSAEHGKRLIQHSRGGNRYCRVSHCSATANHVCAFFAGHDDENVFCKEHNCVAEGDLTDTWLGSIRAMAAKINKAKVSRLIVVRNFGRPD